MKIKFIILAAATVLLLGGCATKQGSGTLIGAGLGAVIGNVVDCKGCALIGGALGAFAGSMVGKNMDDQDRMNTQRAINNNRVGQTSSWTNPDTNTKYNVTPTRTFQRNDDHGNSQYCREVEVENAKVGGQHVKSYTTGCRQPDGSWKLD